MASSPSGFSIPLSKSKRQRLITYTKCVICQGDKEEILRKAKGSSIDTLKRALNLRKDEVYDRLHEELPNFMNRDVFWHSTCYSSYTSEQNIHYAMEINDTEVENKTVNEETRRVSRSSTGVSIDWSKCFICRNKTYKKCREMHSVCTFKACESVRQAAESIGDEEMLHVLNSVNHDLIAAEAKYHKTCFASYISKSNLKHKGFKENEAEASYDTSFEEMAAEISEGIFQGKAYDMLSLLSKYRRRLEHNGINAKSYSKQRLKLRLQKHFGENIVFHQHPDKSKPEVIYSSNISLQDVLNAAAAAAQNAPTRSESNVSDNAQQIINTARWVREEIRKCSGISLRPLNVDDVSLQSARRIIPPSLYWLVRIMITSDDTVDNFDQPSTCIKIKDERRILSIAQDIIHCASNARVKLPKQIGLAIAVRHLTGSKQLVVLLHRMGHSSSYDELQAVDTSLATEVLAKSETYGTVIPSNISSGSFVQLAADNNDLNEETIDGKNTTHATTMVVYQRKVFGPELPPTTAGDHSQRRRSLKRSGNVYELQECSAHGRRPSVTQYTGAVDKEWLKGEGRVLSEAINADETWAILRLKPASLMEPGIATQEVQPVPSWSGFNSILYPDSPSVSKIGYCPMIEGSSTELSTVYTVMKHAQKICASLGQLNTVITFDLAIYVKAKQIQLKFPEEFTDTVIRLGGFHIALNFLSLLGKKFCSSGLEDLLIESGVYAAGTTSALMKGKSFNRGIRAHKLAMEALFRLKWNAFIARYAGQTRDNEECVVNEDAVIRKTEKCRRALIQKADMRSSVEELQQETAELRSLFQDFIEESGKHSKMFAFWEEYGHMVKLLLQFVKAERTGNWELHLLSVAAMVPHFFSMDRPNYARWLPVYIMDMRQLATKHPEVHKEFVNGNHAVSRSSKPFAQVWTDMALEQTINADSKSKGGIIGISQNPGALDRWFLTSHERASVTTALKYMFTQERDRVDIHKEAAPKRVARDEADVQKLISCFTSDLMSSPFTQEAELLVNFATGVVLPPDIANDLVRSTEKGREQMNTFVEKRLNTNQISFWDPISKLKVKTFESTTKKVQVKAINDKLITVGADRELFGRLLIAANVRQINLKEVLCYELSTVPFSLAHSDGSLRKTTKSALAALIEAKVNVCPRLQPSPRDTIHLIDGMALVQVLKSAGSSTFGELASKYLKVITTSLTNCNEVHIVFDQYWDASIKAGERARRGSLNASLEVKIHGPSTPIPKQWGKFIPNSQNKTNLCDFLSESFCSLGRQQFSPGKTLVIGGGFKNGKRAVIVRRGQCEDVNELESDHEEADTR